MDSQIIVEYAPLVLVIISIAIQYKIFMTPADFQRARADFIQYVAEHYVPYATYREGHREVQDQLALLRSDLSEVKNLLISRSK